MISGLEDRLLSLIKDLEEEKRLADKRAKQLYLAAAGGPTTFVGLTDTPANYSGGAGKFVKVNATPNGLIFVNIVAGDLPAHAPQAHASAHHVSGGDLVNHNSLTGYDAAKHLTLPSTIANVLTDHGAHLALGGTSATAHRGDHGVAAYSHSGHAILALGTSSVTAYRGDHGLAAYNLRHAVAHLLTTHSDWATYFNQAVKTGSTPSFDGIDLTGPINKVGTLNIVSEGRVHCTGTNFVAISCYTETTTNALNLNVSGSGYIKRKSSSIKYKGDVKDLELDSSLIYGLRPISFNSKCAGDDKDRRRHGLVSEEIEQVLPEIVEYGPGGEVEGYDSDMLAALILAETQRHEARIKDLEAQLIN